jgi:hypothetical protein
VSTFTLDDAIKLANQLLDGLHSLQPSTPPTVPPTPSPAVPSASRLIFAEDFESGLSNWNQTAKQAQITTERFHSSGHCLLVDQPALGWGGELVRSFPPRDQVYVSLWWFFPAEFDFNTAQSPGRHFWRLGGTNNCQLDSGPNLGMLQIISFFPGEVNLWSTVPNKLPRDRWFRLSFFYKLNAVGKSNGELRVWVDGAQTCHVTGQTYRSGSDQINSLRLVTNWDDCDSSKFGCRWFYDDIEVRDAPPPVP